MPLRDVIQLPSGRVVAVQMPNLPAILAQVGRVPNQLIVDLLNHLVKEGSWAPSSEPNEDKYLDKRNTVLGWYAAAALTLQSPRLVLPPRQPSPEADEIGPDDLTMEDLEVLYHGCFRGWYRAPAAGARPDEPADPGGAPGDVPAGGDIPAAAG